MKQEKTMKRKSGKQSGFTLIELMIVIAIIGILAAVAIPNFLAARNKTMYTACVETLQGLKVALEMYMTDFGYYPDNAGLCAAGNWCDDIATYMIPGTPAAGEVATRVGGSCTNVTFTAVGAAGPGTTFDYQLTATSKEKWQAKICLTPAGYTPTNYKLEVVDVGGNVMACP